LLTTHCLSINKDQCNIDIYYFKQCSPLNTFTLSLSYISLVYLTNHTISSPLSPLSWQIKLYQQINNHQSKSDQTRPDQAKHYKTIGQATEITNPTN
jgi:hypothetical protein